MKKLLFLVCLLLLGMFTSCESNNGDYVGLKQLGIDKSKGYLNNYTDTHGGFLGDGCTYIEIQFSL